MRRTAMTTSPMRWRGSRGFSRSAVPTTTWLGSGRSLRASPPFPIFLELEACDGSGSAAPSAIIDAHRPHQIGASDSARLRDAERAAEEAYAERNDRLANAWRSPDNPPPPPLKKGQSPRDAYIERVTNAWRAPPGRNDPADDVEALQRRWASPGATPGPGRRPMEDAAVGRAEADQAYAEYCARLQSAWKTR
jgi:hypothetical protein